MSSARSAKKKSPAATKKSSRSSAKSAAKKRVAPKKAAAQKSTAKKASTKKTSKAVATEGENEMVTMCRQIAEIVESHTHSELIIDNGEMNLVIRRGDVQQTGIPMMAHMSAAPMAQAPAAPAAPAESAPAAQAIEEDLLHSVTSPFVGTFYRAPNPDSSAYCEVGQRVEKGQVLCIVEAMKLMNEIEADIGGTLVAVLVDNAEPVEYGQSLFKIQP